MQVSPSSIVLLTLSLVACGGGASGAIPAETTGAAEPPPVGGEPAADADAASPPAVAAPAAGCGSTKKPGTGFQRRTMKVQGEARRYALQVPASYDPGRPTRLVFVFHGLGGDGDQIRQYFGFEAEAGGQAIFVYPDGIHEWQGATAWDQSDLLFFDAMVAEISASYCVDAKRIFATGHSFGGYMSNLVGCERGDVVRAIAPVSGGIIAGACKGAVAAWVAHGDKDLTVPQSEGIAARDHWVSENGCASTTKASTPSPCVAYDGCSAGHPVTWCSFGGGHYPLPAFTKKAIWDFFERM